MSSELLNALNPHIANGRVRPRNHPSSRTEDVSARPQTHQIHEPPSPTEVPLQSPPSFPSPQPSSQQIRNNVPYSSELELAMVAPPPPPQQRPPAQIPRPGFQAFQELLRVVATTKHANELERQRRLAWEQEQEAKRNQQQAELERQILELKAEVSMMKAFMTTPQPQQLAQPLLSPALPEPSAYIEEVPASTNDALTTYGAPMTPGSHATYDTSSLPMFVEGSSSRPISVPPSPSLPSHLSPQSLPTPGTPGVSHRTASTAPTSSTVQSAQSWTTSGSSHIHPDAAARPPSRLTALPSPAQTPVVTAAQPPANRRKRRTPPPRVDSDEDSDVDSDFEFRSKRRRNGHDTRCLTIATAMRVHIYRCMQRNHGEPLPDPHIEGAQLGPGDPVRFVWGRTLKQSPHNRAMKKRILKDLKGHRHLYSDVPDDSFSNEKLASTFDQAFKTLNQKWRAQSDDTVAAHQRQREDQKAAKSRRRGRKKAKLKRRVDRRNEMQVFAHPTFDSTLLNECMSSEESCDDAEPTDPSCQLIRVRGLPWRSSRLLYFYSILDADDIPEEFLQADATTVAKPRRTINRKERRIGPPKEGDHLPPSGVARWMVSRRWLDEQRQLRPDVVQQLEAAIVDHPDFDWDRFHALGEESEAEFEDEPEQVPERAYFPQSNTSYSLSNALTQV